MVFTHYDSPIKFDYLNLTPFSDCIFICGSSEEITAKLRDYQKRPQNYHHLIDKGYNWVSQQTWIKLARDYETLWQK